MSLSYYSGSNQDDLTKDIDLIVNFDNNTLTYSGTFYPLRDIPPVLNINGSFTDRGQITGSVDFLHRSTTLIGIIGQDEAIGVFSSGGAAGGSLGGGFRVTRE